MSPPLPRHAPVLPLVLWTALVLASPRASAADALTAGWLAAQTGTTTWQADVRQVRTLKSLAQPLTAEGRVWFAAPNLFRWELGTPARTIAVRQTAEMWVVYPKLKRAERYPLDGTASGPWRETLALLEAGFPRSEAELTNRFTILSETTAGDLHQVTLEPRAAAARRLMPRLAVAFATNDFSLRRTELTFADGSTLRNEFTNPLANRPLPPELFTPPTGADYRIVAPGERQP